MTTATTRQAESTGSPVLMMAFELAEKYWKLGFTTGTAQRARRRQIWTILASRDQGLGLP